MESSPSVRLNLFGSPSVEHSGTLHVLPFERRSQLCVLLALRRGWVPRAEVASMLWPDLPAKLAFNNVRKTLFRLPALAWATAVEAQQSALRFEPATDVHDFEDALREQRHDAALALYRGELLAGFDDGQSDGWTRWIEFERERLRAAWRGAALAWLDEAQHDAAAAVALATRLLEADPLDEAALRALMQWQRRQGQAGAARQAWRAFVDRLQRELGIEPGTELRALHDALGQPSMPAPLAGAPAPAADDGFVGRGVECRRIAELLGRAECRLLCLVGPGGVGKTRLARRTMALVAPQFGDGALFVELEDATTPAQFGSALARAAGTGRGRGDDALAQAIDALRDLDVLLVLDNFEQLAEHAALLGRLLEACPRLKLLLTSRTRLAVAGEWSMPVEGLPWPEPEDEDRAQAFDAVRLFVKAAQRVEPGFAAAAEQHAIVDICRQVEGLPLAIELAAAWVRVLSCEAIAAELRHGSELLRARDAAHPARHASIEQVFEQSWQRLAPAERDALARLSVFRGGFTAEAARAVAGASLPVLGALNDKSLLHKDEQGRLHLHPLVQQLAALRLDEDAALCVRTRAAHAALFHTRLQQLHPSADRGERQALDALDAEFENLRQAWHAALAAGQADLLARSVPALASHCEHRARFEDGLVLLRQLTDSPLGTREPALHANALAFAALLEYRMARYDAAEATAERALTAARRARDGMARLTATKVLSSCASITGRLDAARQRCEEAVALARTLSHGVAQALENLSLVQKRLGHYEDSVHLQSEALAQYRRDGNLAALAIGLVNLASMNMFMEEYAQAAAHLREALALSEREGLTSTLAFAHANLTELANKQQDWGAARTHAERALELAQANGMRMLVGWLQSQLARLALRRHQWDEARALLAESVELALVLNAPALKSAALLAFAELAEAQGEPTVARRVLAFGADQDSIGMADRDELRLEWARRSAAATVPDPAWPGMALDALLQRVVVERGAAHAPLIQQLALPR